jgi:hypothetical protein
MPNPFSPQQGFVGSSLLHSGAIAVLLFVIAVPLSVAAARRERQPWLAPLLLGSLLLHFVGALAQSVVAAKIYHNSADFQGYDGDGRTLASGIRHLSITMSGLKIPGTGSVSVVTGGIYAVLGVDKFGGFFVFTALAVAGLYFAYRGARIALPNANHGLLAGLLFLLPSLLYWPSQPGKEALMLFTLGLMVLGAAHLFERHLIGLIPLALGSAGGALVRPHEVVLLFAAFAIALILQRPQNGVARSPGTWAFTAIVAVGGTVAAAFVTKDFLHLNSLSFSSVTGAIQSAHQSTQKSGAGYGSSYSGWHSSPLYYPYDVYLVMFKPLPFQAHSATQVIAALENLSLIVLLIVRWRSLKAIPRRILDTPFVMMAVLYSLAFFYVFSALGNLGLLDRERSLLFPLLLPLLVLGARRGADTTDTKRTRARADWDVPGLLELAPGAGAVAPPDRLSV